eukprot:CAMPEP_0198598940 /NCGR_PEP_ID=MMETSP1462-20131121/146342_1 /TAXON_ID=1333877 /ORGANISM="Brandtodinium nutriculum, Strain RCC3387" /LENGTH=336 /DNA_ID=CAMNT_0044330619 /DNA_START=16 /DNA_END=1023 /DNA_ORIENTATION=-
MRSECVGPMSGWQPRFLLVHAVGSGSLGNERLIGAVPLYLKMHSDGEFCEENEWIEAAARLKVRYWPRLFVGVPFTPHQGRRLLIAPWLKKRERQVVQQTLLQALTTLASQARLSVNVAFCAADEAEQLEAAGFIRRAALQAWWRNRTPTPYQDFDDFLGALRVKAATTIARQREAIRDMTNVHVEVIDGASDSAAVTPGLMAEVFEGCYAPTQLRHGNAVHTPEGRIKFDLSEGFFMHLAARFSHRIILVIARDSTKQGRIVGGALAFVKGRKICGRYWGYPLSEGSTPHLHFECCYHRLIEHAIENGYTLVEPGNGGGSIYRVQRSRGFEPVST